MLAKYPESVLQWVGEPAEAATLDPEFAAWTVRLVHHRRHGPPRTLADAVRREGSAGAHGGAVGKIRPEAAEILDVLADDTTLATQVAYLYGDEEASMMCFSALGISGRDGFEHAVAMHADQTDGDNSERRRP